MHGHLRECSRRDVHNAAHSPNGEPPRKAPGCDAARFRCTEVSGAFGTFQAISFEGSAASINLLCLPQLRRVFRAAIADKLRMGRALLRTNYSFQSVPVSGTIMP